MIKNFTSLFLQTLVLFLIRRNIFCTAKPDEFINPMKQNIFLLTPHTFDSIISRFRDANGVSLLLHFSSKNKTLKNFIDNVYNEAAKETNNMIRLAAIDCNEHKKFCQENHNSDLQYPKVILYPPHPIPPMPLDKLSKSQLIKTAIQFIPGKHIVHLNSSSINNFLKQNTAIPKVLLFSNKKTVPVIYKALSNSFSDRLNFGFIDSSNSALAKNFNVKNLPKVLVFRSASKIPEIYDGPIKYSHLYDWINVRAETFVKGGGFSSSRSSEQQNKPWLTDLLPEMTRLSHKDICFTKSGLCAVYLAKGKISQEDTDFLIKLSQDYSSTTSLGPKFYWMWMDITKEPHFQSVLEVNPSNLPSFVIINPQKRLRFMSLKKTQIATKEAIRGILERIVAGDGRFTSFPHQKIPSFHREANASKINKQDEL